ncbi:MAG TPA: ergothioneine biosynthesis protein EgtB [Acidimicrobiales bacterium]
MSAIPATTSTGAPTLEDYQAVRDLTEALAAPLSPEDQTVQSMPDVSPTKWHRAHVTWFFETFVLTPNVDGYEPFHPDFGYLFNSYYETVGRRHARADRGLITRPGVEEIAAYRGHVDDAMARFLSERDLAAAVGALVELGLHHEQQHQELLLMDIQHVLSTNPLEPAYLPAASAPGGESRPLGWLDHDGGLVEIGHAGEGFAFDNESPRHSVWLDPFALADRPVTNGDWLAFVDDGGYRRPELWLSDGWATVQAAEATAPLYWRWRDGTWTEFTLTGAVPLDRGRPVVHVNYYEADAFARWSDARLPTEAEWEAVAAGAPAEGRHLDLDRLRPETGPDGDPGLFGDVWEWTSSAYLPYPGFRPATGAVGEYNGKFMVSQHVLRGGSCITPVGHVRPTYRNFFPPGAQWAYSGVRLARDAEAVR